MKCIVSDKKHNYIERFVNMDSIISNKDESKNLSLYWGNYIRDDGIMETSMYKEVIICDIVLTLKIYLQSTGDKVFYNSVSVLDSVIALNKFSSDGFAEFEWYKNELIDEINSIIYYNIYSNVSTNNIIDNLRKSLLNLSEFKVNTDEPTKY